MPMSRDDLAAAIQASIAKSTGGQAQGDYKNPAPSPVNLNNIAPPKPDPEASALMQIRQAAGNGAVNMPQSSNGINPDTGMPYFSPQAAPSPQDQQRQDMMAAKLQYLRNKSQGQ